MKARRGGPERGALARANLAGDHGDEALGDRILETLEEALEARQGIQVLDRNVLGEGLSGQAIGIGEGDHCDPPEKSVPLRYGAEDGAVDWGGLGGAWSSSGLSDLPRRTRLLMAWSRGTRKPAEASSFQISTRSGSSAW